MLGAMASRGCWFRTAPVLIAALVAAGTAAADDGKTATDDAKVQREADDRFQEGKALLAQNQIAAACQKFEQSLALLRRGGTLLNLAVCREKEGRQATAMRLFQEALTAAIADKRPDREQLARERLAEVRAQVSWITIKLDAGAAAPGLEIRCDEQPVPDASWGSPLAFDAGAHKVVASAPGRAPLEIAVTLTTPGEQRTVAVPPLTPLAPETKGTATAAPSATTPPTSVATPPTGALPTASNTGSPPPSGGAWRLPVGIVTLVVGPSALIVGGVFGMEAISANNATRALCPNNHCTSTEGVQKNKDAKAYALVADVAFPVGLAALGTCVFLIATSGSSDAPAAPAGRASAPKPAPWAILPSVGPDGGSFTLRGAF